MDTLQQFIQTLSSQIPDSRHSNLSVGDVVFVQNGYGLWLDKGYQIIGFDKNPKEKDWVYINWDCYWFGKSPCCIVPEKSWKRNRSWVARVYSVNSTLFNSLELQREYNVVSDWDNPILPTDEQLIAHSTEVFQWNETDERGIFLVHNEMASLFWQKEIKAADEPEYYDPICNFSDGATVVFTLEDLNMLEQVGTKNVNTPALAKLIKFVEIARNEIAKGNTIYYRAF